MSPAGGRRGRPQNRAPHTGSGRRRRPAPTGAFSTLLRQSGMRASTGGVLATKNEYTLIFAPCLVLRLWSLQRWRIAVRWSAPEVLVGRPHSPASNVWSYGVLAWEVFSFGQTPYDLWNDDQVAVAVTSGAVLSRPSVCVIIFSVESRRRDFSGEGRRGRMRGWQHHAGIRSGTEKN